MNKLNKYFFSDIIRSLLFAILLSFAVVLIFAVFVKFLSVPESVIIPVNTGIKTFCILVGILVGIKEKQSGLVMGLIIGVSYILLSYLIFALLAGGFGNATLTIFDVLLGVAAGIISGVIKVNIKK